MKKIAKKKASTKTSKKKSTKKKLSKKLQKQFDLAKTIPNALLDKVSSTPKTWETIYPELWSGLSEMFPELRDEQLSLIFHYTYALNDCALQFLLDEDAHIVYSANPNVLSDIAGGSLVRALLDTITDYIQRVGDTEFDTDEVLSEIDRVDEAEHRKRN